MVRNLQILSGQINYSTIRLQRETTNMNIVRVTLLVIFNLYQEQVEIVCIPSNNTVLSYSLVNQNFAQVDNSIITSINSNTNNTNQLAIT